MISRIASLFHRHDFSYTSADGRRSSEAAYAAAAAFVTRRCRCGESGRNLGYRLDVGHDR